MRNTRNDSRRELPWAFYPGLFLFSFCLLSSEILLTRILSVVFWNHLVFFVVSIALFGMTVGALLVYLLPRFFPIEATFQKISLYALLGSLATLISLLSLFYLPFFFARHGMEHGLMPFLYCLLALPFVASGLVLSLSLSRFPQDVGKIYGINLAGSAMGCLGIVFALNRFNAASVILCIVCLGGLSARLFADCGRMSERFKLICVLAAFFSSLFAAFNQHFDAIRPLWAKGEAIVGAPFYDRWNYQSYLSVHIPSRWPFGWGYSEKLFLRPPSDIPTEELMVTIDEGAGTVMTRFDDISDLAYLKFDISALAYYLRGYEDVLVLGSGGGRDLLTALVFGTRNITGVEINAGINDILFDKFRDFSGRILDYPQVRWVVDEGRSFLERSDERYDLIQASLVDTMASTANGAFALTENGLYTKEAWIIFLRHLKGDGILTFTRFYKKDDPAALYRLLTLARSALASEGVALPRQHVALVHLRDHGDAETGVATILVSKRPFTSLELKSLGQASRDLLFEVLLSPEVSKEPRLAALLEEGSPDLLWRKFSSDISPPSDDRPFFFYFAKAKEVFQKKPAHEGAATMRNLFIAVCFFAAAFILLPLLLGARGFPLTKTSFSGVVYFASIGLGFMVVEMFLMQKLGLLLGHPGYGVTVVLFSLLLSCGLGSALTGFFRRKTQIAVSLTLLNGILLFIIFFLPMAFRLVTGSAISVRILFSVCLASSVGIFMGMPFPLGMRTAAFTDEIGETYSPRVIYWGANGFMSVFGSVFSVFLFIHFGFQRSLVLALSCYLLASVLLLARLRARMPG